jgi:hypothetical protein
MFPYRRLCVVGLIGTSMSAMQGCEPPGKKQSAEFRGDNEYYGETSGIDFEDDDSDEEFVSSCLEAQFALANNPEHEGVDFSGVDCSGQELSHANLSRAKLRNANFSAANLSHADLSHTDLSGADLSGADLSHANLTNAILTNVDLSRADLSNAILEGAEIVEVDTELAIINPKYDWVFCEARGECWVEDDGGWSDDGGWDECPPAEDDVEVIDEESHADGSDAGSALRSVRTSCAVPDKDPADEDVEEDDEVTDDEEE